jgi:hypothetical protein
MQLAMCVKHDHEHNNGLHIHLFKTLIHKEITMFK